MIRCTLHGLAGELTLVTGRLYFRPYDGRGRFVTADEVEV